MAAHQPVLGFGLNLFTGVLSGAGEALRSKPHTEPKAHGTIAKMSLAELLEQRGERRAEQRNEEKNEEEGGEE